MKKGRRLTEDEKKEMWKLLDNGYKVIYKYSEKFFLRKKKDIIKLSYEEMYQLEHTLKNFRDNGCWYEHILIRKDNNKIFGFKRI